jgi:hypothetical protein
MTEEEWVLADSRRLAPLAQEVERLSARKQRLFCVALCRRLDLGRFGIASEEILGVLEQFADKSRTKSALRVVRMRLRDTQAALSASGSPDIRQFSALELGILAASERLGASEHLIVQVMVTFPLARSRFDLAQARREMYAVYREIAGPDGVEVFDSAWRTSTAIALAKQMYDSRDFSIMPILGDALEDAGCDNEDILSHCRDPQATHVRGCWVVDLILGKS